MAWTVVSKLWRRRIRSLNLDRANLPWILLLVPPRDLRMPQIGSMQILSRIVATTGLQSVPQIAGCSVSLGAWFIESFLQSSRFRSAFCRVIRDNARPQLHPQLIQANRTYFTPEFIMVGHEGTIFSLEFANAWYRNDYTSESRFIVVDFVLRFLQLEFVRYRRRPAGRTLGMWFFPYGVHCSTARIAETCHALRQWVNRPALQMYFWLPHLRRPLR